MSSLTEDNKILIEENFNHIQKLIDILWNMEFRHTFAEVKMDKSDFMGLAYETICANMSSWDKDKSGLMTYLKMVISNKARTYITRQKRIKRCAQTYALSLHTKLPNDNELELIEVIENKEGYYNATINTELIHELVKSLDNMKERLLVELSVDGYTCEEICKTIHVSPQWVRNIMKDIGTRTAVLRVLSTCGVRLRGE